MTMTDINAAIANSEQLEQAGHLPDPLPREWIAHLAWQKVPKEQRDAVYNSMAPGGPILTDMTDLSEPADYKHVPLTPVGVRSVGPVQFFTHDLCQQRHCQPTPTDIHARNLLHWSELCSAGNPELSRVLFNASMRISYLVREVAELRATIDDLRKPAVCQPEREP